MRKHKCSPPLPFRTRFRCGSIYFDLTLRKRVTRRPVLQKVRHHTTLLLRIKHSALTVCKQMVSGSISFPSRGAFHLSLTVLVHYRSAGYLALESGLPSFPPGSSCPAVLKNTCNTVRILSTTGLSPATAGLSRARSSSMKFCNCAGSVHHPTCVLQHPMYNVAHYHIHWVWAFPGSFATTTGIVSFLRGT